MNQIFMIKILQIVHSDGFMNIMMENVLFTDAMGRKSKFESFFVQNRLVRYVQIPQHVNIQQSLEEAVQPLGRGRL